MRCLVLYILFLLLPKSTFGQDDVNSKELVGYGCGYGGEMSIPAQRVSKQLRAKEYEQISNLLVSKNPAEQYLSVIVLERLDSLNLYELSEAEKVSVGKIKKSYDQVSFCSGCTIWITRTVSELFSSEFLDIGNSWIDRELSRPPPQLYGIVTDGKGNPLNGCNVIIKGTKVGTVTNSCGEFNLPFDSDELVLVFHDMTYNDMRAFEIRLDQSKIDSKQVVFQLGKNMKPNDLCSKVDKKLRKYKIK